MSGRGAGQELLFRAHGGLPRASGWASGVVGGRVADCEPGRFDEAAAPITARTSCARRPPARSRSHLAPAAAPPPPRSCRPRRPRALLASAARSPACARGPARPASPRPARPSLWSAPPASLSGSPRGGTPARARPPAARPPLARQSPSGTAGTRRSHVHRACMCIACAFGLHRMCMCIACASHVHCMCIKSASHVHHVMCIPPGRNAPRRRRTGCRGHRPRSQRRPGPQQGGWTWPEPAHGCIHLCALPVWYDLMCMPLHMHMHMQAPAAPRGASARPTRTGTGSAAPPPPAP